MWTLRSTVIRNRSLLVPTLVDFEVRLLLFETLPETYVLRVTSLLLIFCLIFSQLGERCVANKMSVHDLSNSLTTRIVEVTVVVKKTCTYGQA